MAWTGWAPQPISQHFHKGKASISPDALWTGERLSDPEEQAAAQGPEPHPKGCMSPGPSYIGMNSLRCGAVPHTPVCKELPSNVMVRGHQGVDLISLENPKHISSPIVPGTQLWPRCPQQPFPQGEIPAIPCSFSQPFSQGLGRKASDSQCPIPTLLLERGS